MRTLSLTRTALGAMVLLACTPTEPCACPPARTSVVLYGTVRTSDGAPAAGTTLHYLLAQPAGTAENLCQFDSPTDHPGPAGASADAAGRFRTEIFSVFSPATRCLRVSASGPTGTAQVDGLLVHFRQRQPDSVGLVLTLR